MFLCSCASQKVSTIEANDLSTQLNKICIEGSGKGRIEIPGSKYIFTYESQLNLSKNLFELALDFPLIGESKIDLNLTPSEENKRSRKIELIALLREKIGNRFDRDHISEAMEEFFNFASEFVRFKTLNTIPKNFNAQMINNHFIIASDTASYKFIVDNFSENKIFFERTVFRLFLKSSSEVDPMITLFLVPESCDQ